jgi:hypothetical protein
MKHLPTKVTCATYKRIRLQRTCMTKQVLNRHGKSHTKGSIYVAPLLYYEFPLLRNALTVVTRREWCQIQYLRTASLELLTILLKLKVKCTLVQALRLCTGRTAQRGSRGIAVPFHDHGTRKVWGVSVTPRPLFIPGKDSVPIVQEAGWAPGPVWTGVENLAPTGIRSPDRQARSQSLYRLS